MSGWRRPESWIRNCSASRRFRLDPRARLSSDDPAEVSFSLFAIRVIRRTFAKEQPIHFDTKMSFLQHFPPNALFFRFAFFHAAAGDEPELLPTIFDFQQQDAMVFKDHSLMRRTKAVASSRA